MTERAPTPPETAVARRLSRLIAMARAADGWERLWRGLIPPLIVVGLFVCVSWLGLWLEVPHTARLVGVVLFAILLVASTFGLWRLRPLSRQAALRRIDKATGLAHRPASVLEDTLATSGRDPATDALWALHRRRAEADAAKLKPGRPSPRVVDLDRYAVRAGILVALFACALVAGPQRYARLAAAFDFGDAGAGGPGYRIDAWIDPPPYTGRPPILLGLADAASGDVRKIAAPAGSTVIVRSSGGSPVEVETTGPLLAPPPKPAAPSPGDGKDATKGAKTQDATKIASNAEATAPDDAETKLVLHGDSRLVLRHGGVLRGRFDLVAIADKPPSIVLREIPKANARGTLTLATTTNDDYGVAGAEASFSNPKIDGEPVAGPSLVPAPKAPLAVPAMTKGIGDGLTTIDLSEHPWAGATVTMTLVARDEGGNEGRSDPVEITLPQKIFNNPLARALVEQRRALVLDPRSRSTVSAALDALMIAPESFGTKPSVYLGLRFAADSLANARGPKQLVEVADYLWGMALQLENGDLTEAEKALRNAEKELRDAIERRAPDEEIQKLTQNLQAAMDKFLKELAEQQQKDDKQQSAEQQRQSGKGSKTISQKDLQKLLDKLREQARSGNREEAKKALDELQDILENLKTAKRQKADPQARAAAEGLNQLDQMMRDQQDLRDETFKQGQDPQGQQQGQNGEEPSPQMPGGRGTGQRPGKGQQGQSKSAQGQPGQGQPGQGQSGQGQNGKSLEERQQELNDRLSALQKKLKQAGQGQNALEDAARDMGEAKDALKQGEGSNGQAVDAQGRALDALRKGAKKLADSMQQQGDPNGEAKSDSEGQGQGEGQGQDGSAESQANSEADPLGRQRGGTSTKLDSFGIPAAQRAQRVLEELRKRLGDPMRAQEEIDYLERLLRSY